jgi:hypothetical protein
MKGSTRTFLIVLAMATILGTVTTGAAVAGKGGNGHHGAGGTLSLVLLDGATQAQHGGRITFDVSTTATDRPFVGLRCYQGSNFVLDGYVGFFPTYMFDPWLTLDSPYWADGVAASCTARLFYFDNRGGENVLATIVFDVAP